MKRDGMNYAPIGKVKQVVEPAEFTFAAAFLDHGHINGMTNGLLEAGATLKWVYDSDPEKANEFVKAYPQAQIATSFMEILTDPTVKLVAAAAVPNLRSQIGNQVMSAGKDYFTDKTGFTSLAQLEITKKVVKETGQRYFIYFSERLHVEAAVRAGEIISSGILGDIIQVTGFGPHRLDKENRPNWFFEKEKYGGILCDIGSHQIEQFLSFSGNTNARVIHSKVGNYANPAYPELEDYGDATLIGENGASFIFKVDWFTPEGLSTWGDGRTFITGTKGTLELRKYLNVATEVTTDHLFLVTETEEIHEKVAGKIGFPFFGEMILDCLAGTEKAMTQAHIFKAQELALIAQASAQKIN